MGFEYFVFCKNLVFCALMRVIYVLHGFCMLCIWLVYYVSVVPVLCLSCACSLCVMTLVKHDHRNLLTIIEYCSKLFPLLFLLIKHGVGKLRSLSIARKLLLIYERCSLNVK